MPSGAVIIGVLAGIVPFFVACTKLKACFRYDDALDTFGVHAVGGTLGAFLTGFFADPGTNPNLAHLAGNTLWLEQLKAMGLTLTLSIAATTVIGFGLKWTMGLRPSVETEELGLDDAEHGEAGYHPEEGGGHGPNDNESVPNAVGLAKAQS